MGLFQFRLAAGVPLSDLTLTTPLPPWLTGLVSTSLRLPARPLLLFMQFKGGQQHASRDSRTLMDSRPERSGQLSFWIKTFSR